MALIRQAIQEDHQEIARLLTVLGHPTSAQDICDRWESWTAEGNICLVFELSDCKLGALAVLHKMSVLHRPRPVGRIAALVVDEQLRGQGVGRALVERAEIYLKQADCGLLEITSKKRLVDAHRFYKHLGFENTSERFGKILDRT